MENLIDVASRIVSFFSSRMGADMDCPFCHHHYIHTDESNIGKGDRKYEKNVCLLVLLERAVNSASHDAEE